MKFTFLKKSTEKKHRKVKVGLALGGGASRGIAHIGAIKAFEENGIDFDFVAGTSVGSIIGAFYASGKSANEMLKVAKSLAVKDIRKSKFFMPSKTDGIELLLKENLGDIDIKELSKPYCAVAVDLISAEEVIITKGNLAKAAAGSCAIPGVFNPVIFDKMHLADGGLQNNIPSDVPRYFGCDYVIAIDVNSTRGGGTTSLKLIDVLKTTIGIMSKSNCIKGYSDADLVIKPSLKKYKSTKLDEVDEMFAEGYLAALDNIPKILSIISKKPKWAYKKKYKDIDDKKPIII
ncbi:MAG: patatin-like phospholipase family protein [Clostridia bacterium]|nr:patatin-like phospholipase family protein [Clostridia bacterium]